MKSKSTEGKSSREAALSLVLDNSELITKVSCISHLNIHDLNTHILCHTPTMATCGGGDFAMRMGLTFINTRKICIEEKGCNNTLFFEGDVFVFGRGESTLASIFATLFAFVGTL